MTTNNKISNLISSQAPFFVRNDHQTFIRFLEAYYEYLEQTGKAVDIGKNLIDYRDVDLTIDMFSEKLYQEYMKLIPEDVRADKDLLLKHIKDFYLARGTEKSIRFLLNILYQKEDVEFYYPKKDILRASDGKWYVQKSLRITETKLDGNADSDIVTLENFIGTVVSGNTSNAYATVERVDRFFEQGTQIDELILSGIRGSFNNGEEVFTLFNDDNNTTRSLTANVFGGIINSINIVDAGSRYNVGDHVIIVSATGSGACSVVGRVTTGNISSIVVLDGGAGYQNNSYLLITGGGGSGANGQVISVLDDGSVHPNTYNINYDLISFEAETPINNAIYSNLNTAIVATPNANTALIDALDFFVYANTGPVRTIYMNFAGSGYIETPSISIVANTRIKELGILGRMEIVDGGTGYTEGDLIEFINIPGGYGSGALGNVANVASNGYIQTIEFIEMSGHIIGGSGFDQNHLPLANVVTATGSGANIVVTSVLAEGGSFLASNTTLGAIERITILNRGSGYDQNTTIDLTQSGDGTANATASIIEGVFTYPGRFLNDDGFLSSYNFLEDRDYYQNFSYVVRVKESIAKYRKALKDLIHPAGMKLFGQYILEDNSENVSLSPDSDDSLQLVTLEKSYTKTGNTINISYVSHSYSANDTVLLEFVSGGFTNVKNGIYIISTTSTDNFEVIQPRSGVSTITITNAGLGYNANSYLVFSEENGKSANGTFTTNANGAIITANITDYGHYYSTFPTVTANGSNSSAAVFSVTLNHYANNTSGNVKVASYLT